MPPAIARGSTTREVPQQFDVTSKFTQDDLLRAVLSRRAQLSADRKLPVGEWVGRLLTSRSSMVQVGANDHSVHYGNTDPGPYCVKRGWKTLLIEPVPTLFAKLSTQYDSSFVHNSRTRLLNAAVCSRSCVAENRTFWSVDMSNATGNWGTNRSDARCAQLGGAAWVSEIASLRQWHLIAQARNLKYTQAKCDKCAGKLGKPMPPDCLSQVIQENMVSHVVSCTCLAEELREWTAVTLLMIDTEGYGASVLRPASLHPFKGFLALPLIALPLMNPMVHGRRLRSSQAVSV